MESKDTSMIAYAVCPDEDRASLAGWGG
jgi:hypothetical protein